MPRARADSLARHRARLVVAVLVAATAVVALAVPAAADHGEAPVTTYAPPVAAPISDPFRPPSTPYGRGNRGLEYDTVAGEVVRAAAAGTVTFSGQVGGRLHVTVRHPDGLRTTYGPLARIAPGVVAGRAVAAGEPVGTAGSLLLWTARLGSAYVDPAVLLSASGATRVRLVPDRPSRPARRATPLGPR